MPKISVIIPIYNVEQYIAQCLESMISQTMRDIEIICVDDCGSDNSMQIATEFARRDSRIKIVPHTENVGLSAARNTGVEHSSAPYIMFCDSDDWYAPDMCQKMYDAIESNNTDVAICAANVIYDADEHLRRGDDEYFTPRGAGIVDLTPDVVYSTNVLAWNKIYRRSIIDKYNLQFPTGLKYEDLYFWRAYAPHCKNMCIVPERLYNYRRRSGSIMNETYSGNSTAAIDHIHIAIRYYEHLRRWDMLNTIWEDMFWSKFFVPYVALTHNLCRHSAYAINTINDLTKQFVIENYTFGLRAADTDASVRRILNGTFVYSRRFLGGVVKIQAAPDKWQMRIFGIPVWITRHRGGGRHHYMLGLRVA